VINMSWKKIIKTDWELNTGGERHKQVGVAFKISLDKVLENDTKGRQVNLEDIDAVQRFRQEKLDLLTDLQQKTADYIEELKLRIQGR